MAKPINPLPSLIRASAWDAGNFRMRKAGRSKWNRGDFNEAARTQNRLIRACYCRELDGPDDNWCFIRFQIAESLQRAGHFDLKTPMTTVHKMIDLAVAAAERGAA
jgi:hypothetical protein